MSAPRAEPAGAEKQGSDRLERVETARLVLRRPGPSDAEGFCELFADDEVSRFPWGHGLRQSEALRLLAQTTRHWEAEGFGVWAAEERGGGPLAGLVGLSVPFFLPEILPAVEVGWRFHPRAWGRGLAEEAARAGLEAGFCDLGLDAVVSVTQPGNRRSWRLIERLGMRPVRRTMHPRRRLSLVVYEMTAADFHGTDG